MNSPASIVTEQAVVFGAAQHLVGIVHEPSERGDAADFAVIMLTPGMLHSAGPFRLHLDIAKALTHMQILNLRFDLSGIGESLAVGISGTSLERAASEISSAIDFLQEQYGVRRVALFGLCSGADDAIFSAINEPRIVGVFAVDGCGYRTSRFYFERVRHHYLPKVLSPRKWSNLLRKIFGSPVPSPPSLQLQSDIREFPSQQKSAQQLAQLASLGTRLHFHYTGGVDFYYNYADQFWEMFPGLRGNSYVSTSFHCESDHVGFLIEHRQQLVDLSAKVLNDFRLNHRTDAPPLPSPVVDTTIALPNSALEDNRQTALFPSFATDFSPQPTNSAEIPG